MSFKANNSAMVVSREVDFVIPGNTENALEYNTCDISLRRKSNIKSIGNSEVNTGDAGRHIGRHN